MHMHNSIPFLGAIFDLDGTLLDSLWVWERVDERFFGARHMAVPEDYGRTVAGMSFAETARYTARLLGNRESPDQIMAEWMDLASEAYAREVTLVEGARDYLRLLKRSGIRLAAATVNRRELVAPALERLGLDALFDRVLTAREVGDGNKSDGRLFLHSAEALGLDPSDCVVFEDTLEGVRGARAAGMRAYAVRSAAFDHAIREIGGLAEAAIDDYFDMADHHPLPRDPRRCVIFTAHCQGDPAAAYAPRPGDFILCADAGWRLAAGMGLQPDLIIGDFDSGDPPGEGRVERFPVEKDDTDTMLCLKRGLGLGFDDFLIVGGFGGRLDHTLANLQTLNYAALNRARAEMSDGINWATVIAGGQVRVPRLAGTLSLFSLSDCCRGVSIDGAKYNARDLTLTNATSLGASNQVVEDWAQIRVREGSLLVMTQAAATPPLAQWKI